MEFNEWLENNYGVSDSVQEFGKTDMRDVFNAGKNSRRVETVVGKQIAVEYKDGWIMLLKAGDIKISYPKSDVKKFIDDLTKALNGERLSTLG